MSTDPLAALLATKLNLVDLQLLIAHALFLTSNEAQMNANSQQHKVLVAYATRGGTTQGVAEAIASHLAKEGASVDVLPVAAVQSLDTYQAVVVGSAIQGGAWLPEAMQFVQFHQDEMRQKPFAAFLVCMTMAMPKSADYRSHVSKWLDPVRAAVHPVSEGLFAGAFDLQRVKSSGDRLKFKLATLLGFWPQGDHRDWKSIHAWSDGLVPLLLRKA